MLSFNSKTFEAVLVIHSVNILFWELLALGVPIRHISPAWQDVSYMLHLYHQGDIISMSGGATSLINSGVVFKYKVRKKPECFHTVILFCAAICLIPHYCHLLSNYATSF